jgi:iron complex transport system permease protein
MIRSPALRIAILIAVALAAALFSLHSGPANTPWGEIFAYLRGVTLDPQSMILIQALRAPRTIAALMIGASLGVSGLILQSLLKNPLAEPYTLGLSGGSSLGAVIALNLGLQPALVWIPALSTAGCLAATVIVLGLARRRLEFESRSIILFGVMVSLFFGALVVSGMAILSPDKMQAALFWLLGELGTSRDEWIYIMGPVLALGLVFALIKARALDALVLGESRTLSLGYSPRLERGLLILLCTILTALSVSIAGLIGFIGLVSPHLARRFVLSSRHSVLMAGSSLIGASLLAFADGIGRVVAGTTEVPAGSVAALVGAPILIFLLVDQRHAPVE